MKLTYFVLLAAATPIFSAGKLERRVEKLEQEMDQIRVQTVYGNVGAKTPSAAPVINRFGPLVYAQAIYWKPFEGGTEFAFTNNTSPPVAPYLGEIVQFNFDWQWGFRIGLGYQFDNPDWEVATEYTRVKFHASKNEKAPTGGSLEASGLSTATDSDRTDFSKAQAKWSTAFSILDFTLSRPYLVRPSLALQPTIGVRAAWIFQRDQVDYYSGASVANMLKNNNGTSSIGILGGSQMNWRWTKNWGLYSSLTGSLLYGKFSVATKSLTSDEIVLNISEDTYKVLPNLSADAGVKWQMCFNRMKLFASLGYEFQYWWQQNQRPHFNETTTYSWLRYAEDLGFQGININAGIDF